MADILEVAVGMEGLIGAEHLKPGALVIDVGVSRVPKPDGGSRLVGDLRFDEVAEVGGVITPVPGGVGPVTVALLLRNTVAAVRKQMQRPGTGQEASGRLPLVQPVAHWAPRRVVHRLIPQSSMPCSAMKPRCRTKM